jgi:hypothetical protein
MSSKPKEETLKRSRGSDSSISSDRPMAKRPKESGGFDYGTSEKFYNNVIVSLQPIILHVIYDVLTGETFFWSLVATISSHHVLATLLLTLTSLITDQHVYP